MKNDKFGNVILNLLYKNKGVLSVNIVGSYSENKSFETIGDIDVVVICKKISKSIVSKLKDDLLYLNKKKYIKKNIIINSSFGPLKITKKNCLPIHLMIYDIKSHINHVNKSPFTCYDWERSNWYRGTKLDKIYPVIKLELNDFFSARRNSIEYLKELNKNKISIRKLIFKNKKIYTKKNFTYIDGRNRGEFVFHPQQ